MATKTQDEKNKSETHSSDHFRTVGCPGYTESGKGVYIHEDELINKNKRAIKKFFHRLKESVGITERTNISKEFNDAMEHIDRYKLCLDHLSDALCTATQENGRFRITAPRVDFESPAKKDQYEMVATCLTSNKSFEDYNNYKQQMRLYQKQATEHRNYLRRARHALRNIHTFVQHDYWMIAVQRKELDNLRSEMDFAKADLIATKESQLVEAKTKVYNTAVSAYEKKLAQVTSLMDAFPKSRISHVTDVLDWTKCTQQYHDKMAKLLDGDEKKVV